MVTLGLRISTHLARQPFYSTQNNSVSKHHPRFDLDPVLWTRTALFLRRLRGFGSPVGFAPCVLPIPLSACELRPLGSGTLFVLLWIRFEVGPVSSTHAPLAFGRVPIAVGWIYTELRKLLHHLAFFAGFFGSGFCPSALRGRLLSAALAARRVVLRELFRVRARLAFVRVPVGIAPVQHERLKRFCLHAFDAGLGSRGHR